MDAKGFTFCWKAGWLFFISRRKTCQRLPASQNKALSPSPAKFGMDLWCVHSCPNKLMPEGSLHAPAPHTEAFLLHQTIPGGMEAPFTTSLALNKGREVMANLLPCCHVSHHVLSQSPKEFRPPQHPKEHQGVGATTFSHVSSSCTAGRQPDRMGRIKHRKGRWAVLQLWTKTPVLLAQPPAGYLSSRKRGAGWWPLDLLERQASLLPFCRDIQVFTNPSPLPHPFPLLGAQVVIPGPRCLGCDTTHPHLLQSSSLDLGFGSVPAVRSVIAMEAMEAGWGHSLVLMSWQK